MIYFKLYAAAEQDESVVDPEALIALTAELGDADARLRDVSTDWCVTYGRYVNGSRLKRVASELGSPGDAIGEYVATVAGAGGPTWPLATSPRPDYAFRGKARLETSSTRARLRIRLRAAFGVNARADVLAALLGSPEMGLSVADLARTTRFTRQNIVFAVEALVLAGLVEARAVGSERRFALLGRTTILPGLRPPVPQPDWVSRFRIVLELVRFERRSAMTPSIRSIESRRLVESIWQGIVSEDLPRPNLDAMGVEFASAYDRWIVHIVDWLRSQK
ncbi:MAG TPA: helix-turn-helix domain-containing protein [Candidatus Limnocylindria bacterium]|nr:helix-turn-helix domain-containing protein [Candidatus Limnocylindria bacterium]